jgi:hypothetical protein
MKKLIKKILKEETSLSERLRRTILRRGWRRASDMIGFSKMYEIAFDNDYTNFLDLFSGMESTYNSEYNSDIYCLNDSYCPVHFYRPDEDIMVSKDKIWSFFTDGLGLTNNETSKIIKSWLESEYGLTSKSYRPMHPYSTISPDGYE